MFGIKPKLSEIKHNLTTHRCDYRVEVIRGNCDKDGRQIITMAFCHLEEDHTHAHLIGVEPLVEQERNTFHQLCVGDYVDCNAGKLRVTSVINDHTFQVET